LVCDGLWIMIQSNRISCVCQASQEVRIRCESLRGC
jgi:hypothetical protein